MAPKTSKKKASDENESEKPQDDVREENSSDEDLSDSEGQGWWEAGKKGKPSKKVRFVCKGGEEPCGKTITGKEKSIQCEACLDWFHPKCQELCAEAFNAIRTYDLLWVCDKCRKRMNSLLDVGRRMESSVDKAEKRITTAVAEAKRESSKEMERKVQEELRKMEEQVVKQLNCTSETMKKAVWSQEKRAERDSNLIVHGLKESEQMDPEAQKEADIKEVLEMTRKICGDEANPKIAKVFRLGRKQVAGDSSNTGKPRLVLVKFETKEDASKMFQKRFQLKEAGYWNVYINRDLSMEERERQHKLRVELREKGRETHKIFQGRVVPRDQ